MCAALRRRTIIFAALLLLGVVPSSNLTAESPLRVPVKLPTELLGTWRQVDDGRFLHLKDSAADFFDSTTTICYRVAPDSGRPLHESYELYSLDKHGKSLKLWKHDYGGRFERFYYNEFVRAESLPDDSLLNRAPMIDSRIQGSWRN